MQKNLYNTYEFFSGWNFNSTLFYLHLPSLKEEEKKELTTKIINHKGAITFTLSTETILVVENSNFFKNKNNQELIKDFNKILFLDNNYIRKINIKDNRQKKINISKIIRIITIDALYTEINIFESKYFDYFIKKGLDKNISEKNILCLYPKNKYKKTQELIFYNFNNSEKLEENDIPFYHPKAPENFALFCSEYEYRQIIKHIKTEEYKNQLKEKKIKLEEEQIIKTEPEPSKEQFLCQICKARFDNYLEHIKSNLHTKNKTRYNETFINIKNTFKRIIEHNKNKNKNEIIHFESTIFISTKEDSMSINEDNHKIIKEDKKNLEKIIEKNEENEKTQKNIEEKAISVKDILTILNTIEVKEINRNKIKKKRKKNETNIFEKDKNYIGEFKGITKKISYYNYLMNALK